MKKLIIVCEDKLHRYGDFLAQLISDHDDDEDKVVGVKDGSAAAQVWGEKEYTANAAQISSEQYILFIGNSKLFKDKRHHMEKKFSKYGMNYGWRGKQAALFVDQDLTLEEYDDFYTYAVQEFAVGKQPEITRLLPAEEDKKEQVIDAVPTAEAEKEQEKKGLKKLLINPIESAKVAVKKTADVSKEAFSKVSQSLNVTVKGKDLEDQQYSCLTLAFYLNDISSFLDLNED